MMVNILQNSFSKRRQKARD